MDRAIITLKLKVKYIYCAKCGKKPLDFSQTKVNKFINEHIGHATNFGEYCRVVGYIKKPKKIKILVQFLKLKVKEEKERRICSYKKCKNYSKKAKEYCSRECSNKRYKIKKEK